MMDEERDPTIQSLFADAMQNLNDDEFTERVMERIDRQRRATFRLRMFVIIVALAVAWLLKIPLQEGATVLTQALSVSLIEIDNPVLGQLLMPLNSIAGILGIAVLALVSLYRRILG